MKFKTKILIGTIVCLIAGAAAWIIISPGGGNGLEQILHYIGTLAIEIIEFLGYPGLIILMALESMIFPLPSELVMPFAGFLVAEGKMNFWLVVSMSTLGSIIGSLISYYIGLWGGNKFVLKLGKYFLLDVDDLKKTEKWFQEKGEKTIFISRFVPVVRHFISIPAGIGKMNLKKFCIYTIFGAAIWNGFLTYLGILFGRNWETIRNYSKYISIIAAVALLAAGFYSAYRHIKNKKRKKAELP